jgi:sigma-B regulation protein RsbU (phosphoserine phosphatase)
MNTAPTARGDAFRPRLLERRARLQAVSGSVSSEYLNDLIAEIDAALERVNSGSYGMCESCHDTIELDRLECNPLVRFCLEHLNRAEMDAHQQDLDLAAQIKSKLLPPKDIALEHWDTRYRYQPVGAVGGDYCELTVLDDGQSLFFAVGDVSGKGVAASLLMTHLSAIFRSLLSLDLPLAELVSRANRLFCESTGPAHYATLVCGFATPDGVDICNAGHCPPLLLRRDTTQRVDSTGLPLGLFCGGRYATRRLSLEAGDSLLLYTDGITEAENEAGDEYRDERLIRILRNHFDHGVDAMADSVLPDVARFRQAHPPADDMTLLVVCRRG